MNINAKRSLRLTTALALVAMTAGPVLAQGSASSHTSGFRYDAAGRLTGTISPDPDGSGPLKYAAVRNTYDLAGRLIKEEQGELSSWQSEATAPSAWAGFAVHQTVETIYDVLDRKVRETVSGGSNQTLTQYSYYLDGGLECTAIRMNPATFGSLPSSACTLSAQGPAGPDRITKHVYDLEGQLLAVKRAVGTTLEQNEQTYTYNLTGKRLSLTDARGFRAEMTWDGHDRQARWIFPSKTATATANTQDFEEYGYDPSGNRTSLRKRDGQIIQYGYDALNRMTSKNVPGTAGDVTYSYDLRGIQTNALFVSNGQGVSNIYDGFGRLTSSTTNVGGAGRSLSYEYDANGNRTRITHPDNNFFIYGYDGLDRMNFMQQIGGYILSESITYKPQGGRAVFTRGQNVGSTTYSYDGISRLSGIAHDLNGNGYDQSLGFGYNSASQITSRTSSNDAYAWIVEGNQNTAYMRNGLNQYSSIGGITHTYDANGNLTSDGATTYGYDAENRLISATGTKNAILTYDPLGRLASLTSGGNTTQFLYDGDELVLEYVNGTINRRYMYGDGDDEPFAWYEGPQLWELRYPFTDQQGSIIGVADGAGVWRYLNSYDEYGLPAAANQGRFQYTGQAWLPEIGIYHYKARAYQPKLGRFMQIDPVGYDDQINLYTYVRNDPVNKTDSTGMCVGPAIVPCGVVIAEAAPVVMSGLTATVTLAGAAITWVMSAGKDDDSVPASDRRVSRNDNQRPPTDGKAKAAAPKDPVKAKDRRADQQAQSREAKHGDRNYEEPASEGYAKFRAKQLERTHGKDARREGHDAKKPGDGNRSRRQIDEDYNR